jgi:hypothetical protein
MQNMSAISTNRYVKLLGLGMFAGILLGPQIARADLEPRISGKPGEEHIRSGFGISLQGGGGVTDFTGSTERALTGVGGSWDVRAVLGTRQIVGFEAAYVGSAHGMTTSWGGNTQLVGNGVEGNLRLNLPFLQNEVLVEPFGFVGLGWSNYYLTNFGDAGQVFSNSDAVGAVPMGGGLAVGYRGFMVEARFTYRPYFDDNQLLVAGSNDYLRLDNWNAGVMLGFEF